MLKKAKTKKQKTKPNIILTFFTQKKIDNMIFLKKNVKFLDLILFVVYLNKNSKKNIKMI